MWGNWGMVVAAAQHNTRLSRQIGEQLLRAICLTSQIAAAGAKGNGTALSPDSHRRNRSPRRSRWTPRLMSKGGQMAVVTPGERLMAGDVEQQYPESWAVSSLPAKGYPQLMPRAGGSQLGMLQ